MLLSVIVLLVFWKPIYWFVSYLMHKDTNTVNLIKIKNWFLSLWSLISPIGVNSSEKEQAVPKNPQSNA